MYRVILRYKKSGNVLVGFYQHSEFLELCKPQDRFDILDYLQTLEEADGEFKRVFEDMEADFASYTPEEWNIKLNAPSAWRKKLDRMC